MADSESNLESDIIPMPNADPLLDSRRREASPLIGYLASFTLTAIAAVVAIGIDRALSMPNVSLVFVVPVIVAGVSFGFGPSLCSAVLGALAYNFFLTEPRYTLVVDDPANIWAICLLFLVGLIVSGIAFTSRRRAADAAPLRRHAALLQGYRRDVVAADSMNKVMSITSQALATLFQVPAIVMLIAEGNVISAKGVGGLQPEQADRRRDRHWRWATSRAPESTRRWPRALIFGPSQRGKAGLPPLGSHSIPVIALRHQRHRSTSLEVFWRRHFRVSVLR
ncbi:DUF4118 domain-containing protein [Rhizobium sp. IBUN]|uniref:DUF4118 domain-containing protein n=1 Tax=Rhizobium sp. IBUN TaxID=1042326 RepID=UPI00041352ED|nr:DUF4118 domain-containing protein [Rhizobium sp. IBUN]